MFLTVKNLNRYYEINKKISFIPNLKIASTTRTLQFLLKTSKEYDGINFPFEH